MTPSHWWKQNKKTEDVYKITNVAHVSIYIPKDLIAKCYYDEVEEVV